MKGVLNCAAVIVVVLWIPEKLGCRSHIFARVPNGKPLFSKALAHNTGMDAGYVALTLRLALALIPCPHVITGVLGARGPGVVRRNAIVLPAYSLIPDLPALLGYVAYVADMRQFHAGFKEYGPSFGVPALFCGFSSAGLWDLHLRALLLERSSRHRSCRLRPRVLISCNIYKPYLAPDVSDAREAKRAKLASLVVNIGALAFVLGVSEQYAIELPLLSGIWLIQTLPAIVLGLYRRGLHHHALGLGWAAGMAASMSFKSVIYPLRIAGYTILAYAVLYALAINLVVTITLTGIFRVLAVRARQDRTLAV